MALGEIHTLFSNLSGSEIVIIFANKETHKNQWISWKIINIQWTAVYRITKKLEHIWKQVSHMTYAGQPVVNIWLVHYTWQHVVNIWLVHYTWQPVVNLWLVQNVCLVISPTIIMVVKLVSLIKLTESNGKHQQPNPIRKKGYGWK